MGADVRGKRSSPGFVPTAVAWTVIAATLAGVAIAAVCGWGTPAEPAGVTRKSDDVDGAWAYTQLLVRQRLRAPASARFPFGGARGVTPLGDGRYRVRSHVDAQNGFGAVVRTKFDAEVRQVVDGWRLETLRLDN